MTHTPTDSLVFPGVYQLEQGVVQIYRRSKRSLLASSRSAPAL